MKQIILILLLYFISSAKVVCQDKINRASTFNSKHDLHQPYPGNHPISMKFATVHGERKFYIPDLIKHFNHSVSLTNKSIVILKSNTDTMVTAEYKRKVLHGRWMSWHRPGQLYDSGYLDKGIPDGEWKIYYQDGNLRYVRNYDAFLLRKIKNDILRENRYSFYEIAALFKKNPGAAVKHFNAAISFTNHTPSDRYFTSLAERANQNTSTIHDYYPPFLESLHHGLYINYYPNGAIQDSGYYKYGLKEDIWQEWLENGQIKMAGYYHNGYKKGIWKYYNNMGKLIALKEYNAKGKEVFFKRF